MQACFLFSCLVIALPTWAQTVFKCTDAKGAISLQQTPCPGAGQRLDVRPNVAPSPAQTPAPDARTPQYTAKTAAEADKRTVDIAAGVSAGYPVIGMNMNQLAQALGQPNRVNYSDHGNGPREQRIYERGGRKFYVYTEKGTVTGIQHGLAAAPTVARSCPSEIDIRNLETTASSVGQSDASRAALQRQIAAMRACR